MSEYCDLAGALIDINDEDEWRLAELLIAWYRPVVEGFLTHNHPKDEEEPGIPLERFRLALKGLMKSKIPIDYTGLRRSYSIVSDFRELDIGDRVRFIIFVEDELFSYLKECGGLYVGLDFTGFRYECAAMNGLYGRKKRVYRGDRT